MQRWQRHLAFAFGAGSLVACGLVSQSSDKKSTSEPQGKPAVTQASPAATTGPSTTPVADPRSDSVVTQLPTGNGSQITPGGAASDVFVTLTPNSTFADYVDQKGVSHPIPYLEDMEHPVVAVIKGRRVVYGDVTACEDTEKNDVVDKVDLAAVARAGYPVRLGLHLTKAEVAKWSPADVCVIVRICDLKDGDDACKDEYKAATHPTVATTAIAANLLANSDGSVLFHSKNPDKKAGDIVATNEAACSAAIAVLADLITQYPGDVGSCAADTDCQLLALRPQTAQEACGTDFRPAIGPAEFAKIKSVYEGAVASSRLNCPSTAAGGPCTDVWRPKKAVCDKTTNQCRGALPNE